MGPQKIKEWVPNNASRLEHGGVTGKQPFDTENMSFFSLRCLSRDSDVNRNPDFMLGALDSCLPLKTKRLIENRWQAGI